MNLVTIVSSIQELGSVDFDFVEMEQANAITYVFIYKYLCLYKEYTNCLTEPSLKYTELED